MTLMKKDIKQLDGKLDQILTEIQNTTSKTTNDQTSTKAKQTK